MFNFVAGTIFGIVVSTIGFSSFAGIADSGVHKVQQITKQAVE
jgi:hypothetical protein